MDFLLKFSISIFLPEFIANVKVLSTTVWQYFRNSARLSKLPHAVRLGKVAKHPGFNHFHPDDRPF
jgi:hypothetical protein